VTIVVAPSLFTVVKSVVRNYPQAEMHNLVETTDPARSKVIMVAINP